MDSSKRSLLEKMVREPLNFLDKELQELISLELSFNDLRDCIKRIFDLNEEQLKSQSQSDSGKLGKLNKRSNRARKFAFAKKIKKRQFVNDKIIFAEGDSWFQFPYFITDIIDWLNKEPNFYIYCESSAGDWFTNILYDSQIIPALSMLSPDFMLISGGGNDLVGDYKIANMVNSNKNNQSKYNTISEVYQKSKDTKLTKEIAEAVLIAQSYITKEFYAFIWVLKAQYSLLFDSFQNKKNKFNHIKIITHGYDYPIPSDRIGFDIRYPLQPLVNTFVRNGNWLYEPLMVSGIADKIIQRAIMTTFIFEFNIMFRQLALKFDNVYHVDCRGVARSQDDWYDELHLKSHAYKKVAEAYKLIMEPPIKTIPKVIDAAMF